LTGGQARRRPDGRIDPGLRGRLDDRADGRRQAEAGQPVPQAFAALRQPPLDRADRDLQPRRGLLVGQPLQVAQHDRGAEPLGEPVELLIERGAGLGRQVGPGGLSLHLGASLLDGRPPRRLRPTPRGDLQRHAEEPARQRVGPADRSGPPRQDQERRLGGILGVVEPAQDAAADAEHHRPVPLHQRRERRGRVVVAPARQEAPEQLAV
jgi:hypothetical protein